LKLKRLNETTRHKSPTLLDENLKKEKRIHRLKTNNEGGNHEQKRQTFLAVLIVFSMSLQCLICATASADTIYVKADGTGDYPTIQAAIDAAIDGDEVIAAQGTYTGEGNRDISFAGKRITVRSISPGDPNVVATTIIDCEGLGRGFIFNNEEANESILDGFTITNGYAMWRGGGIYILDSGPKISSCIISKNESFDAPGGGVYCEGGSPEISDCTISENSAEHIGGGILLLFLPVQ